MCTSLLSGRYLASLPVHQPLPNHFDQTWLVASDYLKHGKRWARSSINGDHWGVDGLGMLQVRQGHFGRRWALQDGVWVVSEDWKPVDLCLG